jgi:hypothetical protein
VAPISLRAEQAFGLPASTASSDAVRAVPCAPACCCLSCVLAEWASKARWFLSWGVVTQGVCLCDTRGRGVRATDWIQGFRLCDTNGVFCVIQMHCCLSSVGCEVLVVYSCLLITMVQVVWAQHVAQSSNLLVYCCCCVHSCECCHVLVLSVVLTLGKLVYCCLLSWLSPLVAACTLRKR